MLGSCTPQFKDVPGKNGKAKQAIDYCNQIFKIERELQELSPEERYEQRQLQVKPVIEAFYDFLGSFIPMKGKLQTAVHYVLNQKQELMTFLKDGRLEASNNRGRTRHQNRGDWTKKLLIFNKPSRSRS